MKGALPGVPQILKVIVRDEHFTVIREVSSPHQLLDFGEAWSRKRRTERMSPDVDLRTFKYKLDIGSTERAAGGRWLYRRDGLVTKLDHATKPIYELHDAEAFNTLLGIERR